MSRDIGTGGFSNGMSARDNATRYVSDFLEESLNWYEWHRLNKKFWSKALRFGTIIFMCVGTLVSLLPSSIVQDWHVLLLERSVPGIMLALAGLCLTLDKAYGHTSGWKRYMQTSLSLQEAKDKFIFLRCQTEPLLSDQEYINACKQIMLDVRKIISGEVAEWANELTYQQQVQLTKGTDERREGKAA